MLRTLFSFWRYYKERLLTILVGLLIVSSGLGFLTGLSESNKGTVVSTLQNKWKVSYHILVRPVGTTITDPLNQLLEPNIQSGIANGITMDQWEQIKQISDIEIAAPLSIVGYRPLIFKLNAEAGLDEYGIYRVHQEVIADNGMQQQLVSSENHYIAYGPWEGDDAFTEYGVSVSGLNNSKAQFAEDNVLLVGIDPSEENKLVGLDQALVSLPQGQSRYFNNTDYSKMEQEDHYKVIHLPILLSNGSLAKKTYTYKYEKLNLPFNDNQKAVSTMQRIKEMGGKNYLDDVSASSQIMHSYTSDQLLPQMISSLFDAELQLQPARTFQKPMPLLYNAVLSPYKDRWENAYELKSYTTNDEMVQQSFPEFYRSYETPVDSKTKAASNHFMLIPNYIGIYDSSKLQIKSDIDQQFPMDTYNSPIAKAVLDPKGRPINPPVTIRSINNPLGFMSNPPMMMTTIEAASQIIGEQPISVIRVKVTGIDKVNDQNYKKIEKIASEIREKTGLLTDITFASAPEPVIIHVPTSKTQTKLGWIEEYWIKLGTSITLLNEVTAGFSGMVVLILLVALIYVFVSNTISFLVRKKEIAILLCLGWRTGQIRRMLLLEAIILGLFASLVIWSIQGYFIFFQERDVSIVKFICIGLSGMFIYIIGAVAPLVMVNTIRPISAIHSGEHSEASRRVIPVRGLFGLALAYFNGRLKRNLLSVLSMTLPTVLLTFFIFVTVRLKGTFYSSWFGQYVVAKVGVLHYITIGITLFIAILTISEIIWQNISERKDEISILKALGWRNGNIRRLIWLEGTLTGAISGIVSFLISLVVIIIIYRKFPASELIELTPALVVPLVGGLLSSIIPAERIVHMLTKPGVMQANEGPSLWSKIMSGAIVLSSLFFLLITVFTAIHVIGRGITTQPIYTDTADVTQKIKEEPSTQITNENRAEYHLQLTMNEQKTFSVDAKITVSNLSSDDWNQLVFYMIPNVFTQKDDLKVFKADAYFSIEKVLVNGIVAEYSLVGDTLQVSLSGQLHPGVAADVQILYNFRVPQEGIRLTQIEESFVLAQWYPMLATYQNSAWNKKPYDSKVESYFTDFSDFYVNYSLPGEYQIISSADSDPLAPVTSGSIEAKRIKEMTIILSRKLSMISDNIEGINVRVWGDENKGVTEQLMKESLEKAVNALGYFQTEIGGYPHKQIDIFLGGKLSMEYPGLVTVYPNGHWEHSLVHELAHQWFYGVVSNDPYIEGYLDEGMAELATSLYLNDFTFSEDFEKLREGKVKYSNLPLSDYSAGETGVYLYSQPVLKMKSLFCKYDVDGMNFLKDYFEFFQYKQVTTQEFVNFTVDYFKMQDKTFFEQWLDLR